MTSLQVDTAVLRSAAADESRLAADVGGAKIGDLLSGSVSAMPGMQSGSACQDAGTRFDAASGKLTGQMNDFSGDLTSAAKQYDETDEVSRDKITWPPAEQGVGGDSTGGPGGATGPATPIDVGDVTYDRGSPAPASREQTQQYVNQAMDKLGITDPAARARWSEGYLNLCEHESSHNPNAINDYDSNATASTYEVSDGYGNQCSRGIAQCIPTTFAQYHQPGTSNDIYDPVANIAASMNYVMDQYGVLPDGSNLQAQVGQTNAGTRQGY